MPYRSDKQQRFFEGCRSNPGKMKGKCPEKRTLQEFHEAEKRKKEKHGQQ